MSRRSLLLLGLAVTLPSAAVVALSRRNANTVPRDTISAGSDRLPTPTRTAAMNFDSIAALLSSKAPFRPSRRPAAPPRPAAVDPAASAPKPVLVLSGLVLDPTPVAMLEGVPGSDEPRLVRRGDTLGGLRIRSVGPDKVVVSGYDTVWTLQLKNRWP